MNRCVVHTNKVFGNDSTCPDCKKCKHTSYFHTAKNPGSYRCSNCTKVVKTKPVEAEVWFLDESNNWIQE